MRIVIVTTLFTHAVTPTVVAWVEFSAAFKCLFVCLSVCFPHDMFGDPNCIGFWDINDISKTDAATITKLDTEIFYHEAGKTIYFGVRRTKVKVMRHKKLPAWVMVAWSSCECWLLGGYYRLVGSLKFHIVDAFWLFFASLLSLDGFDEFRCTGYLKLESYHSRAHPHTYHFSNMFGWPCIYGRLLLIYSFQFRSACYPRCRNWFFRSSLSLFSQFLTLSLTCDLWPSNLTQIRSRCSILPNV